MLTIPPVQVLGNKESLAYEPWPELNEAYLVSDTFKLPVQVRLAHPLLRVRHMTADLLLDGLN